MSDLVAFLRARLDEDEAAVRAVQDNSEPWPGWWQGDEANFALRTYNGWSLARAVTVEDGFPPGVLAHIVRHDPARVLREVEAKRRILDRYEECVRIANEERFSHPESGLAEAAYELSAFTIPALAAVYRDHPDYDPAWA